MTVSKRKRTGGALRGSHNAPAVKGGRGRTGGTAAPRHIGGITRRQAPSPVVIDCAHEEGMMGRMPGASALGGAGLLLLAVVVVLLPCSVLSLNTPIGESAAAHAVRVSNDGHFIRGGRPFHFVGFNQYYMLEKARNEDTRYMVDDLLYEAEKLGLTVMRTWAFDDTPDGFQIAPGVFDETAFRALDYILDRSAAHGIHVILAIVNYWPDYGGMQTYVDWCADGEAIAPLWLNGSATLTNATVADFYTKPRCRQMYKNTMQVSASHRPPSPAPACTPSLRSPTLTHTHMHMLTRKLFIPSPSAYPLRLLAFPLIDIDEPAQHDQRASVQGGPHDPCVGSCERAEEPWRPQQQHPHVLDTRDVPVRQARVPLSDGHDRLGGVLWVDNPNARDQGQPWGLLGQVDMPGHGFREAARLPFHRLHGRTPLPRCTSMKKRAPRHARTPSSSFPSLPSLCLPSLPLRFLTRITRHPFLFPFLFPFLLLEYSFGSISSAAAVSTA